MAYIRHVVVAALFLAVPLSSAPADEKPARESPGAMVQVGDHRLHMLVEGRGPPNVILEAGFDGALEVWRKVQPEVAKFARVVSYSRAGIGKSEAGPEPRSAEQIATELHTALMKADVKPPYILVGHSAGALYTRVFAHKYPREVEGIVFVDPATEDFYGWLEKNHPEIWNALVEQSRQAPPGIRGQLAALGKSLEQTRQSWPLPEVPIVLLTATKPFPPVMSGENLAVWSKMQDEFLRRLPNARHITTSESDHNVPANQPQLIVHAIKSVIREKEEKVSPVGCKNAADS
jgi:pimeloyl-ACP methyl ester carboxylesterase